MAQDKRFQPLADSVLRQGSRQQWRDFFRGIRQANREVCLDPKYLADPAELQQALAQEDDCIFWLGHACFLIRLNGKYIITDPFLGDRASPVSFAGPKRYIPPALTVHQLPAIDYIVLSHNHYDHLCAPTLRAMANKADITVILPTALGASVRRLGYRNIIELGWYESHEVMNLQFVCLPAYHYSRRGLFDKNKTLWASFAICSEQQTIYFGGDTAYGSEFKKMQQFLPPVDVALVGIGAFKPRELMQHAHASPAEGLQIAADLQARHFIPMHWGSIVLTPEGLAEPVAELELHLSKVGYAGECVILPTGGVFNLSQL